MSSMRSRSRPTGPRRVVVNSAEGVAEMEKAVGARREAENGLRRGGQ